MKTLEKILANILLIIGMLGIGMGIYRGFLYKFGFWQILYGSDSIELFRESGYLMIVGGVFCLLGSTFYWLDLKIDKIEQWIESLFMKKKK